MANKADERLNNCTWFPVFNECFKKQPPFMLKVLPESQIYFEPDASAVSHRPIMNE